MGRLSFEKGLDVYMEAMASGCPCICTDSGGVTDFAKNRENAWVVPYRDSQALAEGIQKIIEEPLFRRRLSLGALRTAKERSWEGVMETLICAYQEVLDGQLRKQA